MPCCIATIASVDQLECSLSGCNSTAAAASYRFRPLQLDSIASRRRPCTLCRLSMVDHGKIRPRMLTPGPKVDHTVGRQGRMSSRVDHRVGRDVGRVRLGRGSSRMDHRVGRLGRVSSRVDHRVVKVGRMDNGMVRLGGGSSRMDHRVGRVGKIVHRLSAMVARGLSVKGSQPGVLSYAHAGYHSDLADTAGSGSADHPGIFAINRQSEERLVLQHRCACPCRCPDLHSKGQYASSNQLGPQMAWLLKLWQARALSQKPCGCYMLSLSRIQECTEIKLHSIPSPATLTQHKLALLTFLITIIEIQRFAAA